MNQQSFFPKDMDCQQNTTGTFAGASKVQPIHKGSETAISETHSIFQ